jgi:hypothetical protein
MSMGSLMRLAQRFRLGGSKPQSPWRTPVILDRGILGEACLALDGQGYGSALWENRGQLWTMSIGPQSTPGLVRLPLGEGSGPRMVLNANGHGIALWQCVVAGERQILGQILDDDEDAAQVIFRTRSLIHHLQAAVDRRGSAIVAWLLETDRRLEVMALSFDTRGKAWEQVPTTLGIPSAPAVEPRIAVNHRAHAMVLWEAEGSLSEGLVASHYWPSERIWSDRPVPVVSHATQHHQVAMDGRGNALALWIHAPPGQRGFLEASYYNELNSEWGEPEVLSRAHVLSQPKLTMSEDGEALAAWCQAESHGASRLITRAFRKGQWEAGLDCLELGHGPVRDFDLDLGQDGQAGLLAVHRGPDGDWISARLRQQEWSASIPWVPASNTPCFFPRIRLCPQGASAAWVQGRGSEMALVLAETW